MIATALVYYILALTGIIGSGIALDEYRHATRKSDRAKQDNKPADSSSH